MDRIHHLFLWLTIIGPLHMVEQMLTSLEEFHMIQGAMAGYYGWFAPDRADLASVVMISLVWTLVSVIIYALLRGGAAMRAVMYVFGVFAVSELHHLRRPHVRALRLGRRTAAQGGLGRGPARASAAGRPLSALHAGPLTHGSPRSSSGRKPARGLGVQEACPIHGG
jgi:hypothetical protein